MHHKRSEKSIFKLLTLHISNNINQGWLILSSIRIDFMSFQMSHFSINIRNFYFYWIFSSKALTFLLIFLPIGVKFCYKSKISRWFVSVKFRKHLYTLKIISIENIKCTYSQSDRHNVTFFGINYIGYHRLIIFIDLDSMKLWQLMEEKSDQTFKLNTKWMTTINN